MSIRSSRSRSSRRFGARALAATTAIAAAFGVVGAGTAVAAPTFSPAVVVTSQNLGEPGIDVASDGTLYINAPASLLSSLPGSPSPVFKSTNGGSSWTETPTSLRSLYPGGGDSDIAIDPADPNTLYMTDLWIGNATVGVSNDAAASWIANPVGGPFVQDRQWIATSGAGVVYHVTHQIPGGIVVSKSVDGGLTYPVMTSAAHVLDQTGCICPPGTLIAEGTGATAGIGDKVGVIYSTSSGGVKFARSTNGALTFSSSAVSPASSADTGAAFPVVANAGGGHLVATWLEIQGNVSRVMFNDSTDWGATWHTPRALVSSGANVFPWIDARGSKVAVTLYHNSSNGTPDSVPEGSSWFETYLESVDGGATFSPLSTVDSTAVKTGPICTQGINCDGDRELLDFQAVALDGAGVANLTWTRSIDGLSDTELRFAKQTG